MEQLHIFIDESGTDEESPFLVVGIVLTENPEALRSSISALIKKTLLDPELRDIPSVKEKRLHTFHYAEDHIEIKSAFIDLLPTLDFDAYVSFIRKSDLTAPINKLALILSLLKVLVYPRLQEKHYKDIHIVYEEFDEGSAASKASIESLIRDQQTRVQKETGKTVVHISVSFASKDELCLCIPDYMAGIVRDYVKSKENGDKMADTYRRFYLRVAGKIRLLNDYTRKVFYSRQNPFN